MTFVDRPLPESLELPTIGKLKRLANLRPRNPGQLNRVTRDLKEGLIEAAVNVGRDGAGTDGLVGFLEDTAIRHRKAFCGLLAKILPMQVTQEGGTTRIQTINVISVPTDNYLSTEDMERIRNQNRRTLEHEPSE